MWIDWKKKKHVIWGCNANTDRTTWTPVLENALSYCPKHAMITFPHRRHYSLQFCHSHFCTSSLLGEKKLMDQLASGLPALLLCLPEKILLCPACIHWYLDSRVFPLLLLTLHFMLVGMFQEEALYLMKYATPCLGMQLQMHGSPRQFQAVCIEFLSWFHDWQDS